MVLEQRNSQPQQLIENTMQRINIRTMKKDLKKLREADAKKETENIIKMDGNAPANKPTIPFKDPSFDAIPTETTPVPSFKAPKPKLNPLPKIKDDIYEPEISPAEERNKEEKKVEEIGIMGEDEPLQKPNEKDFPSTKQAAKPTPPPVKEPEAVHIPKPTPIHTIRVAKPEIPKEPAAEKELEKPTVLTPPKPEPIIETVAKPVTPSTPPSAPVPSPAIHKPAEPEHVFKFESFEEAPTVVIEPAEHIESEVKQSANETEKQQIFLLEGELAQAHNQIKEISKKQEPILIVEKNNILVAQKKLHDKLAPLLRKAKHGSEHDQENLEKQRWSIEKELAELSKKMKGVGDSYKQMKAQEKELAAKTAQINSALKKIAANVKKRKAEEKKAMTTGRQAAHHKTTHTTHEKTAPHHKKTAPHQESTPSPKEVEPLQRTQIQEVAPITKPALDIQIEKEEEQRRKFMEDVEHWAAINNKNNNN